MNNLLKLVSLLALAATILPAVILFAGLIDLDLVKKLALIGTIVWFVATPLWMGRNKPLEEEVVVP